MRVAILGRTSMLFNSMEALKKAGHSIVLIGTSRAEKEYSKDEYDYEMFSSKLGAFFFCDAKIGNEAMDLIKNSGAEIAVSMNWVRMIPQEVIDAFPMGIINIHTGDLPQYKGNACPNWAIINGEKKYAITSHFMDADKLDGGDIVLKKYFPIDQDTTITEIYNNLETEIPRLVVETIEYIEHGGKAVKQNEKGGFRCYPRMPRDSFIDWKNSSEGILNIIRASCSPFDGAYTYINDKKIYIIEAKKDYMDEKCIVVPGQIMNVDKKKNEVRVATGDGSIIIKKVVKDGEKLNATDVFNSIRIRLNYCIEEEVYLLKKEIEQLKKEIKSVKGDCK